MNRLIGGLDVQIDEICSVVLMMNHCTSGSSGMFRVLLYSKLEHGRFTNTILIEFHIS